MLAARHDTRISQHVLSRKLFKNLWLIIVGFRESLSTLFWAAGTNWQKKREVTFFW